MSYIIFGLVWGTLAWILVEYLETIFPGLKALCKKIFTFIVVVFYICYVWILFEGWLYSNIPSGQRMFGWFIIFQALHWYASTLVNKIHLAKQFWVIYFVPYILIRSVGGVWYVFAVLCQNYDTSDAHIWSMWIEFEPAFTDEYGNYHEALMDGFFSTLGTCVKWLSIYLTVMIISVTKSLKR